MRDTYNGDIPVVTTLKRVAAVVAVFGAGVIMLVMCGPLIVEAVP